MKTFFQKNAFSEKLFYTFHLGIDKNESRIDR